MSGLFPGWRMVGVSMVTQAMQAGLLIYAFGTLAVALEDEFSTTRGAVMTTAMVLSIATNLFSPYLGSLVDRGSLRHLMTVGAVLLGVGLWLVALAQSLLQVWIIFGLVISVAQLLLGQLASSALMTRWFVQMRGRALGLSSIGTSLGGFIFPVLLSVLIDLYGWRQALGMIGTGAIVLAAPLIWFGVVDRPGDLGLNPDGGEHSPATPQASPAGGWSLRSIISQPAFWCETIAVGLLLFTYMGFLANLVPHVVGLGISATRASTLMSVVAVFSILGKLTFGTIADRLDLRHTTWIAATLLVLGSLTLSSATSYAAIAAGVVLFGLAAGGLLPVWSAMVARSFGPAGFGRALGAMNLAMMPITMLSAPFAGWVYDATGGYAMVFQAYMATVILAALVLVPLRFPSSEEPL
ncbi:MAG: MFS transporter [Xanthomonadales bacterium]|nr:MFS transporter [Xanthomonadales bacterium]